MTVFRLLYVLESLLGRRLLWRISRRIHLTVRRDGSGDPATNGEYALHGVLARLAASTGQPLTVVDVGACTGYWSEHLLSACRCSGVKEIDLYAFEPAPESRARCKARLEDSGPGYRVHIHGQAISDTPGKARFDAAPANAGINRLLVEGHAAYDAEIKDVVVTTLADVFAREGIDLALFVKSDIEGHDLSLIRGALPLLRDGRIGLLQFEYNHCWLDTRSLLRDVFEITGDLPYRLCKITPSGLEAYDQWNPELERFYEANFVLVRKDLASAVSVRTGRIDAHNTFAVD